MCFKVFRDGLLESRCQSLSSNPALGKQALRGQVTRGSGYPIDVAAAPRRSPTTPTLLNAYLRWQDALNWRKWTKGGCSFLLSSAQF